MFSVYNHQTVVCFSRMHFRNTDKDYFVLPCTFSTRPIVRLGRLCLDTVYIETFKYLGYLFVSESCRLMMPGAVNLMEVLRGSEEHSTFFKLLQDSTLRNPKLNHLHYIFIFLFKENLNSVFVYSPSVNLKKGCFEQVINFKS